MENSTPVSIDLTTVITQTDGSKEELTLTSAGEWMTKNNIDYLKYEESQEAGTVRTIVKMEEDQGVILRSGALKMRLAFRTGEAMVSTYESEYGTLSLVTETKRYVHQATGRNSGRFHVNYNLEMAGSSVGNYEMTINYREAVSK
ncbi:DUF1934 domain-containing protein [Jeotgalibacillus campisalis]|uniref:DUF1934 domain-containing protein n=1 Tax=Jeotgalibacillus campisalis TaxID=220754 RepID=A0A0C2W9K0_9BACL|nr:DUF1934 family protein [Jeotgalibacillus campisalis]KIL52718.1 hypothetical protein KR50_00470 [Jeotgalibacillus campisalis]